MDDLEEGVFRGRKKNLEIYRLAKEGSKFTFTAKEKSFKSNFGINCYSENVINFITFRVCQMQYVGSSITKFKFDHYKSNLKLDVGGRRDFKQKEL